MYNYLSTGKKHQPLFFQEGTVFLKLITINDILLFSSYFLLFQHFFIIITQEILQLESFSKIISFSTTAKFFRKTSFINTIIKKM